MDPRPFGGIHFVIIYIRRTAYCFVFPSEYKYDVDADILFRGGNHLPSRRKNYFWKANSNFWGAKSVFAKDSWENQGNACVAITRKVHHTQRTFLPNNSSFFHDVYSCVPKKNSGIFGRQRPYIEFRQFFPPQATTTSALPTHSDTPISYKFEININKRKYTWRHCLFVFIASFDFLDIWSCIFFEPTAGTT